MTPAEGRYCKLYIDLDEDDNWLPVLCGIDVTFDVEAEMIPKTGPTSGSARRWFRRISSYKSSLTGLTPMSNGDQITWFYMLQLGEATTSKLFKLEFKDIDNNSRTYTGRALIGSQSINSPNADFCNASIDIYWDGKPDADIIPTPLPFGVFELYIDAVENQTSVHHVDLEAAGITILEVSRTGLQFNETTGTPGNQEFRYGGTDGYIYFDTTNSFNANEWVYVLYKT